MKIKQVTTEANIAPQILKDPKMTKMLNIAFRHDSSLPLSQISRLGPRPTDKQIVELWADMLERSLADTLYGNLARLNKFEPWLLKLYINGVVDYEGINGEGGDTLGAWNALSVRGLLKPQHQDFNKFQSIDQLTRALRDYSEILAKIKDQAALEKHKRDRQEIVLIDNERFYVAIPLNYGSCYTFNNAVGVQANFCTGGSSGLSWFKQYSVDGPIIIVFDKANPDKDHGKWQMHTATDQLVDAKQTMRYNLPYNARRFTSLFPGLLEEIMSVISARAEEIHEASKAITKNGYDIGKEIARLSIVNSHKEDQPGGTVAEGRDAEKLYQQNLIREIQTRVSKIIENQSRRYIQGTFGSDEQGYINIKSQNRDGVTVYYNTATGRYKIVSADQKRILYTMDEQDVDSLVQSLIPTKKSRMMEAAGSGTKKPVFSGWLAMTYQRENAGKKFPSNVRSKSGRDLNKIIPQDEFDINDIEIDDDSISMELSPYLYDNFRLSSTGGGAGQGFSEHFYQLPNVRGFNMASELGKRLLAGEAAIKRWFEEHNQSLRKIGLPEYKVECYGGITSPVWHNDDTSDVIADLDQLRAIYKGQAQLGDFWNKGTIGESLDQGVAEDFTDDVDNIYAMHPQPEKSEKIAFLILDKDEIEFATDWRKLSDPYQQEFGYDLPLWDADDFRSYPNLVVKEITFDQYVNLVGNYIKSEELAGSAMSKMKRGVAEGSSDNLRANVLDVLLTIYHGAVNDEDMTDTIDSELGEYFAAVEASNDPKLQKVYAYVRDLADADLDIQASGTLKAMKKLMGPTYTPPPPLAAPDDTAVRDLAGNFAAAMASHGIKAHPDWKKKDKGVAEGSLNEFAPRKGGGNDYLRELASAWYNGIFNTGSLHKGIKSQEDVERVLARGIISADGKTRRYNIDYSPNFDGVVIFSDDYYEHGDLDGNDGRTGKPWGPYDYIEFAGDELNESVSEGEVIKGRFGQKFVPTLGRTVKTSRYERNPDIDVPMYDPVKRRVWHAGIGEPDNREPFDHFEVKSSDIGVTTHIIGVAKDGRRISVSTTSSEELAQALVDAYNRGGFTDKDMEKVPLKESAKIRLSTDPDYFGAEVGDYRATGPIKNINLDKLEGFEPDKKMESPESQQKLESLVAAIQKGEKIPPILVRKYKFGYQILDGHHRFNAFKMLNKNTIPAQIVPDSDIEIISKQEQGNKNAN